MVPTWIGKIGEHFPVREKSGNFTQNTAKNLDKLEVKKRWKPWNEVVTYLLKGSGNSGKVREIWQSEKSGNNE